MIATNTCISDYSSGLVNNPNYHDQQKSSKSLQFEIILQF